MCNNIAHKCIQRPLSKVDGTESDHDIVAVSFKLPKHAKSVSNTFYFSPITTEGVEKFRSLIVPFDWLAIEKATSSESALELDNVLQYFVNECFPLKKRTVRNTDAPWMDKKTKRLLCRKRRIYKAEGKSQKYYQISAICEVAVAKAKEKFLNNVIVKTEKNA